MIDDLRHNVLQAAEDVRAFPSARCQSLVGFCHRRSVAKNVDRFGVPLYLLPMKIRICCSFFLFLFFASIAPSRDSEKIEQWRLDQFQTGKWVNLRFGFEIAHGDYNTSGPQIILQRLPDDRILLSRVENGTLDVPVARRFLTEKEAEAMRAEVSKFLKTAMGEQCLQEWVDTHKGDERLKLMEKHFPHGYTYSQLELRVTKPDGTTVGASARFDERKETLAQFSKFFEGSSVLPMKRVKRDASNKLDPAAAEARELSIKEMELENQKLRTELEKATSELSRLQKMIKDL
jgi:hypothetical protein